MAKQVIISHRSVILWLMRGSTACHATRLLRAVQFLRFKAADWQIDPDRIVATGGSAGGCSVCWLLCMMILPTREQWSGGNFHQELRVHRSRVHKPRWTSWSRIGWWEYFWQSYLTNHSERIRLRKWWKTGKSIRNLLSFVLRLLILPRTIHHYIFSTMWTASFPPLHPQTAFTVRSREIMLEACQKMAWMSLQYREKDRPNQRWAVRAFEAITT